MSEFYKMLEEVKNEVKWVWNTTNNTDYIKLLNKIDLRMGNGVYTNLHNVRALLIMVLIGVYHRNKNEKVLING